MKERKSITYTFDDIRRYKEGRMTTTEMHAFEKASMEDPFLADALEGYMEADMQLADEHLANISERITDKEEERAKVVAMPAQRFGWMRVAAMVIVLAGAGLLTYKLVDKDKIDNNGSVARVEKTTTENGNAALRTDSQTIASVPAEDDKKDKPASVTTAPVVSNGATNSSKDAVADQTTVNASQGSLAVTQTETKEANIPVKAYTVTSNKSEESKVAYENTAETAALQKKTLTNNRGRSNEQFRGQVLNTYQEPVPNAKIRLDNNNRQAITTDDQGNFSLNAKDTVVNATVSSYGYERSNVQLRNNTDNTVYLDVQMQRDANLAEVEVTAIGSAKQKTAKDTVNIKPEGGWHTFQGYIATKLSKADSMAIANADAGEMEVEFSTDKFGNAKDIKIVRSSNPTLNKEIIEALEEGPKWTTRKKRARLLIKF
jgi:hypothetical protein